MNLEGRFFDAAAMVSRVQEARRQLLAEVKAAEESGQKERAERANDALEGYYIFEDQLDALDPEEWKRTDAAEIVERVMVSREQLVVAIEDAIDQRHPGDAARLRRKLQGFDFVAESLDLLDDREWERRMLSERIVSILSLPWKEA